MRTNTKTTWTVSYEGGPVEALRAETFEDAKDEARDWILAGSWEPSGDTIDYWITDVAADERHFFETDIPPVEPACVDRGEHELTGEGCGGVDENPGVWSKGGTTLVFVRRCLKCGRVRREINRGAQRNPNEARVTVTWTAPENDE
jgi:hypothetical protein